jgi:ribosomal protein L16 Arg81 hydroxylase
LDAGLVALATAGASTLVSLMTTDLWAGVKNSLSQLRPDGEPGELSPDKLDACKDALANGVIERDETERILAKAIRTELSARPQGARVIEAFVQQYSQYANLDQKNSGETILKGVAKDGGRVYQQGQGIQYNG